MSTNISNSTFQYHTTVCRARKVSQKLCGPALDKMFPKIIAYNNAVSLMLKASHFEFGGHRYQCAENDELLGKSFEDMMFETLVPAKNLVFNTPTDEGCECRTLRSCTLVLPQGELHFNVNTAMHNPIHLVYEIESGDDIFVKNNKSGVPRRTNSPEKGGRLLWNFRNGVLVNAHQDKAASVIKLTSSKVAA